ncbi:sodium:calcium antiporter [Haloparvum sp. PAK95]|uniref:sodium:calcium antiporter n=1 Tax=Haloparvum sp. PAK95 TaxID=3418962 RepID=UPI003D2ED2A0
MSVLTGVATLLVGLALLIVGSDRTVDSAATLAEVVGFSTFFVGGTLVAVGTSLPEIATAIYAAVYGVGGLAVGHISGSATAQITLGIGLVAVTVSFGVARDNVRKYGGGMLFAMLAMLVVVRSGDVSRLEGALMAGVYALFVSRQFDAEDYDHHKLDVGKSEAADGSEPEVSDGSESDAGDATDDGDAEGATGRAAVARLLAVVLGGLLAVAVGGHLLVAGSQTVALELGVSTHLLGLLTGFGTTVPEVLVALAAVRRSEGDIAGGTLLGSNITDPLFSLGLGAFAGGIVVDEPQVAVLTTGYMLLVSGVVVGMLYWRETLYRRHGVACILLYLPVLMI